MKLLGNNCTGLLGKGDTSRGLWGDSCAGL